MLAPAICRFSHPRCTNPRALLKRSSSTQIKQAEKQWRATFEQFAKKNNFSHADWYHLDSRLLNKNKSIQSIVDEHYQGSLYQTLSSLFPESEWHPWKFATSTRVPDRWNPSNQRKFFDFLGQQIGVQKMDDWYKYLRYSLLEENGARGLLDKTSAADALMRSYPEHNWIPWKFRQVPQGFWESKDNQRKFFDWLGKELGVKQLDDWYRVLNSQVMVENGGTFIRFYNGSSSEALMTCYPEHTWIPWKFNGQQGFWNTIQNHRRFFDWLGKELGVKEPTDWYSRLSLKAVLENGGTFVVRLYNNSAYEALRASYPEINWIPWKFKHAPHNLWKTTAMQRTFFDWLAKELGVKELDDWYRVLNSQVVASHGGYFVRTVYKGSATEALVACYPEHKWDVWKFQQSAVPRGYWNSHNNISKFLSELADRLYIQTLDDWYRVDVIQLQKFGASHIFQRHGGLYEVLRRNYPEHPWQKSKFYRGKKAQRWLIVTLQKLYPDQGLTCQFFLTEIEILEDFMHPKAKFPDTKRPMQLDAFLPKLSLAFEYQGQQHYQDVPLFQPQKHHEGRDTQKRALCAEHNITLIEVPYWWNRTLEGLQEIIQEAPKPKS